MTASAFEKRSDAFFSHGGWTERHGSLGVRLVAVDAGQLRALVVASYERVAEPAKRARKA